VRVFGASAECNSTPASREMMTRRPAKHGRDLLGAEFCVVKLKERAGVEEVVHRLQNRSSRSAMIASDQELTSFAVILRTSS
jgi:hypothetical protein